MDLRRGVTVHLAAHGSVQFADGAEAVGVPKLLGSYSTTFVFVAFKCSLSDD